MEQGDLHNFVTSRLEFLQSSPGGRAECVPRATLYRNFKEKHVIIGIASGLAYLHANIVIHGDLKAANILLGDTLQPKICDFGLTKAMRSEYHLTSAALKGAGSWRWMSPELLKESESAVKTTASDVYAFGIMIAEVITYTNRLHGATANHHPTIDPISTIAVFAPPIRFINRASCNSGRATPTRTTVTQWATVPGPVEPSSLMLGAPFVFTADSREYSDYPCETKSP
ncbi:hypothetical protein FRB94_013165 [Tulasnella sp. JGI-2019a]|nr:hypothetical protein FRB94_013165 [Tulasnella sp. JGI-2019a]